MNASRTLASSAASSDATRRRSRRSADRRASLSCFVRARFRGFVGNEGRFDHDTGEISDRVQAGGARHDPPRLILFVGGGQQRDVGHERHLLAPLSRCHPTRRSMISTFSTWLVVPVALGVPPRHQLTCRPPSAASADTPASTVLSQLVVPAVAHQPLVVLPRRARPAPALSSARSQRGPPSSLRR